MSNLVGWMTRSRAAKELGITEQRLRVLIADRILHTVRDFRRRERIDPDEIAVVKAKLERGKVRDRAATRFRSGEIAAEIFQAFRDGKELREIVIETKQTPDYVLLLRQQYANMGRDFLVTPRGIDQLRDLLDWQGPDEKSLIHAVSARLRYQFQQGQRAALPETTTTQPNGDPHGPRSSDSG